MLRIIFVGLLLFFFTKQRLIFNLRSIAPTLYADVHCTEAEDEKDNMELLIWSDVNVSIPSSMDISLFGSCKC